jgi:hypothetical protein
VGLARSCPRACAISDRVTRNGADVRELTRGALDAIELTG